MKFIKTTITIIIFSLFITLLPLPGIKTKTISAQSLTASERAVLEKELAQLEAEIKEQQKILDDQKKQTGSISKEIQALAKDIQTKKNAIATKNKQIANISSQISNKELTIKQLEAKIKRQQDSLAEIIRKQNQLDSHSLTEIVLSQKTISSFLIDADDFFAIKKSLEKSFDEIRDLQGLTNQEKQTLEEKRSKEADAKAELDLEKRRVEDKEKDQKYLLTQSKTKEKTYEQIVAEKQKQASAIKAKLFTFQDDTKIPFEQALAFAENASRSTGTRASFILATLAQETGYNGETFGRNVGQCFLVNTETGEGKTKSGLVKKNVMKPTRDVQPFLEITASLGMDPMTTPVSCPLSYGYGGAMGIAQFIPSTWKIYANRIATKLGASVANPWNPQHGITAAGVYLGELGASKGGYSAELNASCRYYSGKSCNSSNRWYAESVQKHANAIQKDIDFLNSL